MVEAVGDGGEDACGEEERVCPEEARGEERVGRGRGEEEEEEGGREHGQRGENDQRESRRVNRLVVVGRRDKACRERQGEDDLADVDSAAGGRGVEER